MKAALSLLAPALVLIVFYNGACAQQQPALNKWKFHSVNTAGLLTGHSGNGLQALTVNGAARGKWFAAIGTGVDQYLQSSIPVFVELSRELGAGFSAYADGGINYCRHSGNDNIPFYYWETYKGGYYGEAGLGYTVTLHNNLALVLRSAYSFKKLTEERYIYYDPAVPPGAPLTEKINHNLGRFVIKAGIAF